MRNSTNELTSTGKRFGLRSLFVGKEFRLP
jgi:hypothetical protein